MNIIAAVPFGLSQGGDIFMSPEPGFHPVSCSLTELGKKTAQGHPGQTGVDAIPSCVAHLKKLHSDMQNADLAERYYEEQWRKVMLIFVLSKYRGYEIAVDKITENSCSGTFWKMFGQKLAEETGMKDKICLLRYKRVDIAVFDEKGYLLPVAQFPEEVESELGRNCMDGLEDYEKELLLAYLRELEKETLECQNYISSFVRSLQNAGTNAPDELYTAPALGGSILEGDGIFEGARHACFLRIPALPVDMPPAFHPNLILAVTEKDSNQIRAFGTGHTFGFEVKGKGEAPYYFSGFLPLSREMAEFLEKDSGVRIEQVDIDTSDFQGQHRLQVKLKFAVQETKIILKKYYTQEMIVVADSVPMITIFPYVDLPENLWKRYYIVLRRNKAHTDLDNRFFDGFKRMSGDSIDLLSPSFENATVAGTEEDRQTWYYSVEKRIPRMIKLCTADFETGGQETRNSLKTERYIGCICAGKPTIKQDGSGRTFHWGLDMGTRNTIAAWMSDNLESPSFVLARDGLCRTLIAGMGSMDRDFARECYAPIELVDGSFPTMVRVYASGLDGKGTVCYEQGCALFADLKLIGKFFQNNENLGENAIFTDIKFGRVTQINTTALHIFLFNMLWLGSLECILNGAGTLKVYISYPRGTVKSRIENIWSNIHDEMSDVSGINLSIDYCMEAEANAGYLYKAMQLNPDQAISPKSIFGICDIGDGTSDFNLYLGGSVGKEIPERIQFSMRYAGKDILIDTILQFSRRYREEFVNLWNDASEENRKEAQDLMQKYGDLLAIDNDRQIERLADEMAKRGRNHDVSDIRAGFLEYERNIILALIENVGLTHNIIAVNRIVFQDFLAVLKFKYWNLFHVYGDMLRKFMPEAVSFKLYLYGGGRKALDFTRDHSGQTFEESSFCMDLKAYLSEKARVDVSELSILLNENIGQKTEVVEGMLGGISEGNPMRSDSHSGREDVDSCYLEQHGGGLPEENLDRALKAHLMEGYQDYIEDTRDKKYFELCKGNKFSCVYEAVSLGKDDGGLSEAEKRNRELFSRSLESFWHQITEDADNPSCLWEVLLYTKMSNFLLVENIW